MWEFVITAVQEHKKYRCFVKGMFFILALELNLVIGSFELIRLFYRICLCF